MRQMNAKGEWRDHPRRGILQGALSGPLTDRKDVISKPVKRATSFYTKDEISLRACEKRGLGEIKLMEIRDD
jgi:hypothetical protein